ncbi:MAG: Mrp/NBP35 family ATP-binding protein [Spirochaetales bacterium]|nr:Mrp/NBP35 family ATP-binding protein [Leptospiraceae bacterium]MCP5481179.1 Mrp/NBP35 family ATP-binding protein [Spirochaetales bacterium]
MEQTQLENEIRQAVEGVEHPAFKRSLGDLGMYDRLEQDGEDVLRVFLKTPKQDRKQEIDIEAKVRGALQPLQLPGKVKIRFELDESLAPEETGNRIRGIKNIVAIGSGKGGVGKSTVTANLAAALKLRGHAVGVIDADIYGPSLGKLFGFNGRVALKGDGKNRIDPLDVNGIKLVSFSFMLNPDQAVVWRGPMLGKAVEQFLFQVNWGELDYLLIDLPPGTGDVQLSLAQLIDLDGAIIVTTPQNVALQDAGRAAHMFLEVKVPILGVIENMSLFVCPNCGHESHVFSKNGGQSLASRFKMPLLGEIPLLGDIMESGEEGEPIVLRERGGPVAQAFLAIADKLPTEIDKYR